MIFFGLPFIGDLRVTLRMFMWFFEISSLSKLLCGHIGALQTGGEKLCTTTKEVKKSYLKSHFTL